MTYHVSGDLATSAVLFAQRMSERLKAEREKSAHIRCAEPSILQKHKPSVKMRDHIVRVGTPESAEIAEKARKLIMESGASITEAARVLGFSTATSLRHHMMDVDLPRRAGKIHISAERMDEAIKRIAKKESWKSVARSLGIGETTLRDKMQRHKRGIAT